MEDNYSSLQPAWTFRPAFNESCWFPDTFAHETETITRALQICLSTDSIYTHVFSSAGSPSSLVDTATSASDTETAKRRTQSPALSPPSGKVSKRKSRASKRSTTRFIAADPANFKQVVQQATGVPFGRMNSATKAMLRREPLRPGKGVAMEGSCLPTLDTSAFFLEQEQARGPGFAPAVSSTGSQGFFGSSPETSGFDIHDPSFPSFPTLESWDM